MAKYKIVAEDPEKNIVSGFRVMVKKNWYTRWKYVRRREDPSAHAWWSTKRGAQAYINFLPKDKK